MNSRERVRERDTQYRFQYTAGNGAIVYVIDTGVRASHDQFGGRVHPLKTYYPEEGNKDFIGHGTHVAGTIASRTYGVAKNTQIRAIKIYNKDELYHDGSILIDAIQTAYRDASDTASEYPSAFKGAVINMSLGGERSQSCNDVVNSAVRAGMHIVVAAGNDDRDACEVSPASARLAITVGASTIDDVRAEFSNYGKCVDVFAPGVDILSTWNTDDRATNVIQGTSMASPHVAGLVAYFLSIYPHRTFHPRSYLRDEDALLYEPRLFQKNESTPLLQGNMGLSPYLMKKEIIRLSTRGRLYDVKGSPNSLAYNNYP